MHEASFKFLLSALILSGSILVAQIRESDTLRMTGATPRPISENTTANRSLSTAITAARVELGPGDLLEIKVFETPELTERVRVDSDGKITIPLIGEVLVKGMSPELLQTVIERRLIAGRLLKHPQVSVFVAEYAGQVAYVTGEVEHPGAYSLLRSHRLRDMLSVSGGLTARASNEVTISRAGGAEVRVDLSDSNEQRSNPEITPGDSISVGQTGIVFVLGDVERAGGFRLDRRTSLSVVQALALAEGPKSSASLSKASLIRTAGSSRQEIPLNLKAMLKSGAPDMQVQAGDIIFVPGSPTRGLGRRSLETILATASGVAIYQSYPH